MPEPVVVIDSDEFGIVATHPPRLTLPVLAAPVPEEQKKKNFNTIRQDLVAIGCMKLPNRGFAFDSSIVSPEAERKFTHFARLMQGLRERDEAEPKRFPPCSVFGHADPSGDDDYNKTLSGRRSLAVYGVLTRDVKLWDELFLNSAGGDHWGTRAIQTMLSIPLKKPPKDPLEPPFYVGPIDGAKTKETQDLTKEAVLAYRLSRGMGEGTTLNPDQRHQLFREYMDAICHDPAGEPFVLEPADFIAKGKAGKALKGDVQGCSEFNPVFLLSKSKQETNDPVLKEVRNELNVVNRRVVVFVFRHGTEIDHTVWPCPAAREGKGLCVKRFWSDAKSRRGPAAEDRTFGEDMAFLEVDETNAVVTTPIEQTGNTMACRFYHGFAVNSPCEAKLKEWVIRFKVNSFNGKLEVLRFRRFVVRVGESLDAPVMRGSTDEFGVVRIPMFDRNTRMVIDIDAGRDLTEAEDEPPSDDEPVDESKFLRLILDGGALHFRDIEDDLAVKQRLYNLGFGEHAPAEWTEEEFRIAFTTFRHRNNMDNAPDADVRREIMRQHDLAGVPKPKPPEGEESADGNG